MSKRNLKGLGILATLTRVGLGKNSGRVSRSPRVDDVPSDRASDELLSLEISYKSDVLAHAKYARGDYAKDHAHDHCVDGQSRGDYQLLLILSSNGLLLARASLLPQLIRFAARGASGCVIEGNGVIEFSEILRLYASG
jgi:hypothetical protein